MEDSIIYEIRENVVEIKGSLKSIVENTDLKFQVQEEKIKVANNRIADLEDTIKWLWRAVGTSVIAGIMAFVMKIN